MKFKNLTSESVLTLGDLVTFAGSQGLVMVPIIDLGAQTIQRVPCLATFVVGDNSTQAQIDDFLQPNEDETLLHIPSNWKMAHVMKALGKFPSVTAARKNGWNQDIPKGFSEVRVKLDNVRATICFLNL